MQKIVKDGRTQLIADEGKVVTNGKDVYGYDITLATEVSPDDFYEITQAEYDAYLAEQEQANMPV